MISENNTGNYFCFYRRAGQSKWQDLRAANSDPLSHDPPLPAQIWQLGI
jgi:hypothetical protein